MIYGNKEGIRDSLLAKLETLYDIEIPALRIYLKDSRDAEVEDNQVRGKAWLARGSEN